MRSRLARLGTLSAIIAIAGVLSVTVGSGNVGRVDASVKTFDATLEGTGTARELPIGASAHFARYEHITGEAEDEAHLDWISIESIKWGAHMQPVGRAVPASNPSIDDFVITFIYEKAAPSIAEACLAGDVIGDLQVELTSPGDARTYLGYDLEDVRITDYRVSSDEEGRTLITVANSFTKITVTFYEYDMQGVAEGTTEFTYDVERNESSEPGTRVG
jgi:type VI protein secretion system component Hcp